MTYIYLDALNHLVSDKKLCTKQAKKDLINLCNFIRSVAREGDINNFINDIMHDKFEKPGICALEWYTGKNFVHQILNYFFRKEDFINIYNMRYFIFHLNKDLKRKDIIQR